MRLIMQYIKGVVAGYVREIVGLLEIHDGTKPSWDHSPTGIAVEGISEFDGRGYFDGILDVATDLRIGGNVPSDSASFGVTGGAFMGEFYREISSASSGTRFRFFLRDSNNTKQEYAAFGGEIKTNTAGSEDGRFFVAVVAAGAVAQQRFAVDPDGADLLGYQLEGYKQVIEHHTANDTLTKEESGSVHTNLGEDGDVTLILPQDAAAGCWFHFGVMAAFQLRVDPGAAGAVYINGAKQVDDKFIWANDEAESVVLIADGNGDWLAMSVFGTWGVEA